MLDLKIKDAHIIDGTGREPFFGDVGVSNGTIVAVSKVGHVDDNSKETVHANGATLTPGFIDVHAHYDGQASWDQHLRESAMHGVTSAILGNCGVGFAPVHPEDHERLIALMEGVEDIPGSALHEGITWGWTSFSEYMHKIIKKGHALNLGFQVPHDPLRMYVMRERAVSEVNAQPEDIEQMTKLLREALLAGALGLSIGRTDNHRMRSGDGTPSSEASLDELLGLAAAFTGLTHGVIQVVSDFNIYYGPEAFDAEWNLVEAMLKKANRPGSFSVMERDYEAKQWEKILDRINLYNQHNPHKLLAQVAPRPIGVMLGLNASFHPFLGYPSFKKIAHKTLEEQAAAFRDPHFVNQILSEQSGALSGEGSSVPPLADFLLADIVNLSKRIYVWSGEINYEPPIESSIFYRAEKIRAQDESLERSILRTLLYALSENNGQTLLYFPIYNYHEQNLNHVHEMLTRKEALLGLGDAGAHVGTICDASAPVFALDYWGQKRNGSRIPLSTLIHMQTGKTAQYLGLKDRGTIEIGKRADLNIIDLNNLSLKFPELHNDLPAGGKRFLQKSTGILKTYVSGVLTQDHGESTNTFPGEWLRAN